MSDKQLTLPTVHLNGTHPDDLRKQVKAAVVALREAVDVMCAAAPHGRDYYPQGSDAYPAARREHDARVAAVQAVIEEYTTIVQGIYRARQPA